jgi:hypothetical protein
MRIGRFGEYLGLRGTTQRESEKKLHNEELNDLYTSPNIIRVIKKGRTRWVGHVGERRGVCRVLVGKSEGKRPLGRPRRTWKYNIKRGLQEVG